LIPILLDTSMIVGLLDRTDAGHRLCVEALELPDLVYRPLVTCEAVVSESCFLLGHISGAPEKVLQNLEQGMFQIGFELAAHVSAIENLMRKYSDTPIDFADACLIQMAEELNTGDILTLDSDFKHYRWRKTKHFNLLIQIE
jgi:predicted nucleic acid-binding protein